MYFKNRRPSTKTENRQRKAQGREKKSPYNPSWLSTLTQTEDFFNLFQIIFPNPNKPCANGTWMQIGQEQSGESLLSYSFCVSVFEFDVCLLLSRPGNKQALGNQSTPGMQKSTPWWVGPWPPSSLSVCISFNTPMVMVEVNNDIFLLLFERSPWKSFWDRGPEI